jgi:hypothetical protein
MRALHELWLKDQSIAFAATLLGDGPHLLRHLRRACVEIVIGGLDAVREGNVSDSTLSLVRTIAADYRQPESLADAEFADAGQLAEQITKVVELADKELARRERGTREYLNRVLVSHAVYVLKRPHVSAEKFLKWLHRSSRKATPGLDAILEHLANDGLGLWGRIEKLLEDSRNPHLQTRDRLDSIDDLFAMILESAGWKADVVAPWWARICLGYRSSMFCWPLLVYTPENAGDPESIEPDVSQQRGVSLPVALFLLPDGKSSHKPSGNNMWGQQVWFKHVLSKRTAMRAEEPKFVPAEGDIPAHMGKSHFGWTRNWAQAFQVGLDVAKKLWTTQNGRLRYSDAAAAERLQTSSLNVDLAAASVIVDSVYGRVSEHEWRQVARYKSYFVASDRSAEAYWVQCALGLLLPAHEVPLGICTGVIDYADGEFEMKEVGGLLAKLKYANRSGTPRVVVPGDRSEYIDDDDEPAEAEETVSRFLDNLADGKSSKTTEVNFCRTARAAADAMQASGWRRTEFLRLPDLQRSFSSNQRRLFIRDALRDAQLSKHLKQRDVGWYRSGRTWRDGETRDLAELDHFLLSDKDKSVKYASRAQIRNCFPMHLFEGADVAVGKWLAWKDNQVRTGELASGYRGPGLGVLALRTAKGDNEARLWAALAEILDVDEAWWDRFQWSDLPECAEMLAELLGNQRADPKIGTGSAPDVLVIFDDAELTRTRTNRIFPQHFNKQFYDLLNPRHPGNDKFDHLDKALKKLGVGGMQHATRIIVVYGEEPEPTATELNILSDEDQRALERLALFRFGCSQQSAFSIINHLQGGEEPASWRDVQEILGRLIKAKVLRKSRHMLFVPENVRAKLLGHPLQNDPEAHLHAAKALCPILQPSGFFIAANRDRQLEPEMVLEASWHLERAYSLVPGRFRYQFSRNALFRDSEVSDAQALLTYLRTSPDLDTIKKLRVNNNTSREAIELCFELEEKKFQHSGKYFSAASLGLMIETIGWHCEYQEVSKEEAEKFCSEIAARVEATLQRLPGPASAVDAQYRRRLLRFLFSRQVYAMRTLNAPLSDPRLTGSQMYLDKSIVEALEPDFLEHSGESLERLDDYPIAHKYWECMWKDQESFSTRERSTFAYAAARTNLGRSGSGTTVRDAWVQPWIAYFGLARVGEIDRNQMADPLTTWNAIFGLSEDEASMFGRRVLDLRRHALKTKSGWKEAWIKNINEATLNVWQFLAHPSGSERLYGNPVAHALKFLRSIASQETLPFFHLLANCDSSWICAWPKIMQQHPDTWNYCARTSNPAVADEWRTLARAVVGSSAGWIVMLSSLKSSEDENWRLDCVRSWLFAVETLGGLHLTHSDPENLIQYDRVETSRQCLKDLHDGIRAAEDVLAQRNEKGFALFGHRRKCFLTILSQIRDLRPENPSTARERHKSGRTVSLNATPAT